MADSKIKFNSMPDLPPAIGGFLEYIQKRSEAAMGIDPAFFVTSCQHAEPGARTASGYGQGLDQAIIDQQHILNRMQAGINGMAEIMLRESIKCIAEQFRLPEEREILKGFRRSRLLCGVRRPGRWATRKYGA
jgi:hypothetical protein